MSASVPRCSRRAHFSSRHGEWDTPSRIWSHPTTASPTLRKARLELEAAEELAALELRDIEIQKELIRQRLQVNLQKLEAAAACRLLFRPESYANQQDHLRTTTGFFFEATSAEPPVQPAEQARCTVDPEVLMDVDHMATVAILDKMATPETTARIDIVMASNPQTSTATSCFHSSAVCTRGETTTVIASSPSSSTSTFVSSVTDRDREINRHETATPCTGPRVHKNKSMQHHTLRSGTAEFQVTWLPKLRKGTYLVKNVRARFEYRKTSAAHEKQVIMQEKALACDVRPCTPSESVFLQSTLPLLTMCVCLYIT